MSNSALFFIWFFGWLIAIAYRTTFELFPSIWKAFFWPIWLIVYVVQTITGVGPIQHDS